MGALALRPAVRRALSGAILAAFLGGGTLIACGGRPAAPTAQPCTDVGRASDVEALKELGRAHGLPLVVVGERVVACACATRGVGGDAEARRTGGDAEARRVAGATEGRGLGGDVEARRIAGDQEARGVGGDVEARRTGGDAEARGLGGDIEARRTGGDVEARRTSGATEARGLGGDVAQVAVSCHDEAGCGGFILTGATGAQLFDGVALRPARGSCLE